MHHHHISKLSTEKLENYEVEELTLPVQSSANMQPRDQISIFLPYGSPKITSGARYDLD